MSGVPAIPTSKLTRRLSKSTNAFCGKENKVMNLTERIVEYEKGELNQDQTVELFQELFDSGLVWNLQGHYGRLCFQLLEAGLIKD